MMRAYTKKCTNSRTAASIGASREQLLEEQRKYQALLDSERAALKAEVDVTPATHPAAHTTSLYFQHKYLGEREHHQIAGGHRDGGGRTEGLFLSGSMEEQQQLMQELQTPPQPTNTPQSQQGLVARASHPFKMGADVLEMALFTRTPAVRIYDQSMEGGGSAMAHTTSLYFHHKYLGEREHQIAAGGYRDGEGHTEGPFLRPGHAQVTDYPLSEYLSRRGNAHASLHVATTSSTNMNLTSFPSSLPSSQSFITELSTR